MYRNNRISWQREIYKNHFAPARKTTDITGLLRVFLLMIALALFINVFSPAHIMRELGNGYILLLEQHLPGLAGQVERKPLSTLEGDLSLMDTYTRMLLGSMPPGFSGAAKTAEVHLEPKKTAVYTPEHLIATNKETAENPSPPEAEEPPLALLAAPGTEIYPRADEEEKEELPRVLIYHTHTTESFLPISGKAFTSNLEHTVVFLGELLTEILEVEYGIPVLHHREVFDVPRSAAYAQARPVIAGILEENPQIEVVVDLHRDGVSREITTFSLDGADTARILFVVGTHHAAWNSNLRFALFLQNILDEKYPGLCRGTRRQSVTYNQHVHPRSVLVEIGSHENNKEEVLRTVPYLAEALAEAFD